MSADTTTEPHATEPHSSEQHADASPAAGRFERVLVVTRDDDAGRAAVETGIDLAAAHGAAVDALYVVDVAEEWDVVVERRERTGERLVEDAAERGADAGVDVEKWFRYGTAHEEVLDFAAAHGADLIVVGSARRTGLDRFVHPERLPTRVQRGASAPVLVVGPDDD
ncbi:universal stress protein UspA [Halorubrum salipaludis]|uniref:Universal stress protein UspA n=1 Tax=Halorubrum salipaludis TaxID=2032630 RepID=A0A2A2FF77_9EURY|nr:MULTISPECIES: universal stress protein [Halorubrum]PAU83203.1 universal stress protein UspA [Halorubrum salipaludis]